ncbi:uncharacterized protein LOC129586061 isoform X2 [Paramacrobiotus metropolitanus]|uniref:uncharacterized protein LOC129586061 isoform X2 n=1 Tax=Paramacrobiotus metropolitanus TaxID=2943436 RepID=UPI002445AAA5|nr:uncharacterized protein LOC129586061 isoform X2 [Paramacrobiotus metropolitanus]
MADLKDIKRNAERARDSFKCMVHQTPDGDDYNITPCCGNIMCTACFATLVKNEKDKNKDKKAGEPLFKHLCPSCRSPNWKELRKLGWIKGAADDSGKTVDIIQAAIAVGGRPPCEDATAQASLPTTVKASPRAQMEFCRNVAEIIFPGLDARATQLGYIMLTGVELRWFLEASGSQYYRMLHANEATVFDYGNVAKLMEKLDTPVAAVKSTALADSLFRPSVLLDSKDTTEFVLQWIKPFAIKGKDEYVRTLFERFGLSCIRKEIPYTKPHAVHGPCKPKCAKCRVYGAVRNEELHVYKMDGGERYEVTCALCGVDIEWKEMQRHVRTVHKESKWDVCRCWAPLHGRYAPKIPHGVSCPLRTFPLLTGKRGECNRHKPFLLRSKPTPRRPFRIEKGLYGLSWIWLFEMAELRGCCRGLCEVSGRSADLFLF